MVSFDFLLKLKKLFVVFFTAFLIHSSPVFAQETNSSAPMPDTSNLRVGVAGSSPFVIKRNNGQLDGIALEIWQLLTTKGPLEFGIYLLQ